ncbi:MAG: endolytic transglycosylase MltG [Proteobacteria bacterium]|nr:endolytic transglycosylase MltG [Pseudomonadota bacterium]
MPLNRISRLFLIGSATLLAGLVLGILFIVFNAYRAPHDFYQAAAEEPQLVIIIPNGAGLRGVAKILEDADAITSSELFVWGTRLSGAGSKLRAGEYRLLGPASMAHIRDQLLSGETLQHRLTIPEGLTSRQVMALLAADEALAGEMAALPGEGTLLPETYYFSRGDDRSALLTRMRRNQQQLLDDLWLGRRPDFPFPGAEEAVILASIVEKETALAAERPMIARAFLNRLEGGMRLQSDPTVIYGQTAGEPLGRPLRQSDLDARNAYNTYVIRGLPPGPIANPGVESLRAVFHPAEGNYLYFVADGKGGHAFAATLEEHNRNVARWRRIQRERR